jgi:hypothetical protein
VISPHTYFVVDEVVEVVEAAGVELEVEELPSELVEDLELESELLLDESEEDFGLALE